MHGYAPLGSFLLEPGDILVKKFFIKDPISHAIQFGQAITQGTTFANYVHAAIALDADTLAESQGEGVVKNKLSDNIEHGYKYKVFRCKDREAAERAVEWALLQLKRKPKYSLGKAFLSLFKKDKPKTEESVGLLGDNSLFCSEFTTQCYNRPAYESNSSALIPVESDDINPSKLKGYLEHSSNWECVGDLP